MLLWTSFNGFFSTSSFLNLVIHKDFIFFHICLSLLFLPWLFYLVNSYLSGFSSKICVSGHYPSPMLPTSISMWMSLHAFAVSWLKLSPLSCIKLNFLKYFLVLLTCNYPASQAWNPFVDVSFSFVPSFPLLSLSPFLLSELLFSLPETLISPSLIISGLTVLSVSTLSWFQTISIHSFQRNLPKYGFLSLKFFLLFP